MKNIESIETNTKLKTNIEKEDVKFYNVLHMPFSIHGVFYDEGKFRRLPEDVSKTISKGVFELHSKTAGGRVRFKTDSLYVAINAKMDGIAKFADYALTGAGGFDLYVKEGKEEHYGGTFKPHFNLNDGYEGIIEFDTKKTREITINFPLYSDVLELYIGLSGEALVESHTPYMINKPIVYYGSSITQGGCASRPGNSYQSIISRRFDCDYINLGFSGNAKAEKEIAEYIKQLDMSVFVYDYDHNAPTVEYLADTHEKMFKIIRNENPELPIIIMSKPKFNLTEEDKMRRQVIETTYKNAISAGDNNVYFIDGKTLMQLCEDEGTVDGIHPTSFGFASMAKALGDVLDKNRCFKEN